MDLRVKMVPGPEIVHCQDTKNQDVGNECKFQNHLLYFTLSILLHFVVKIHHHLATQGDMSEQSSPEQPLEKLTS